MQWSLFPLWASVVRELICQEYISEFVNVTCQKSTFNEIFKVKNHCFKVARILMNHKIKKNLSYICTRYTCTKDFFVLNECYYDVNSAVIPTCIRVYVRGNVISSINY